MNLYQWCRHTEFKVAWPLWAFNLVMYMAIAYQFFEHRHESFTRYKTGATIKAAYHGWSGSLLIVAGILAVAGHVILIVRRSRREREEAVQRRDAGQNERARAARDRDKASRAEWRRGRTEVVIRSIFDAFMTEWQRAGRPQVTKVDLRIEDDSFTITVGQDLEVVAYPAADFWFIVRDRSRGVITVDDSRAYCGTPEFVVNGQWSELRFRSETFAEQFGGILAFRIWVWVDTRVA